MRYLAIVAGLAVVVSIVSPAQGGWWHHHCGCAGGTAVGAVATVPGGTVLSGTTMTYGFAPTTLVVPTATMNLVPSNLVANAGANYVDQNSIANARAQGFSDVVEILGPILRLILESRSPGGPGGCTCAGSGNGGLLRPDVGIPGASAPLTPPVPPPDGKSTSNRQTLILISAEEDFQQKLDSIRANQNDLNDTLRRLEERFPAR